MKFIIWLATLCLFSPATGNVGDVNDTEELELKEFNQWMEEYQIKFGSSDEQNYRFKVFEENNKKIKIHNAEKDITYQMGLNQFSDLTDEEFQSIYLIDFSEYILQSKHTKLEEEAENEDIHHEFILHKQNKQHSSKSYNPKKKEEHSFAQTSALPQKVDLVNFNWPVRNQGSCGSCWAFSTIGTIEQNYYFQRRQNFDLSEQQLVDCVYSYGGCNGGWMMDAYNYLTRYIGPFTEQSYPYQTYPSQCRTNYMRKNTPITVSGYYTIQPTADAIRMALAQGKSLTACVDARNWNTYRSGIFSYNPTNLRCTHALIIVGYGQEGSTPYFRLRNSWSAQWGEYGYIRINANSNNGVNVGSLLYQYTFYPRLV